MRQLPVIEARDLGLFFFHPTLKYQTAGLSARTLHQLSGKNAARAERYPQERSRILLLRDHHNL